MGIYCLSLRDPLNTAIKVCLALFSLFVGVLPLSDYLTVKEALMKNNYPFVVKPYVRYEGKREEQHSLDPSGNPIEFKSYGGVDEDFI